MLFRTRLLDLQTDDSDSLQVENDDSDSLQVANDDSDSLTQNDDSDSLTTTRACVCIHGSPRILDSPLHIERKGLGLGHASRSPATAGMATAGSLSLSRRDRRKRTNGDSSDGKSTIPALTPPDTEG